MNQEFHAPWRRIGLAVVGMVLLLDAIVLMVWKGAFSLGVTLPAALGACALLLAWRWSFFARWRSAGRMRTWLWRCGWAALGLWSISVLAFFWSIANADQDGRLQHAPAAIVILGSGSPRCEPSTMLAARLEEGLAQARRWPSAPIVVSGGVDYGLSCSEAGLMADYLAARGVARTRLWLEDRSTSTDENLRFSRLVLQQHGIDEDASVLLVTSDFHLVRAKRIAAKAGLHSVIGAAAPTPLYMRYNAWLREYFATFSSWVLGEF